MKRGNKMKYYLLSGMDESYNFYKNIADRFRKELKAFDTIVYIPTYPENREKCIKLSKSEKFKNIGINFNRSIVLDYSYSFEEIKNIIDENELIFLYGGDPYNQMKFITEYGIRDLIKDKTIIGLSAGSINMCKKAICTKDEDFEKSNMYNGMGLIDFSVEPHFNINNTEVLKDLKNFSKYTDIYALEDDAYIIVENNKLSFYRKCLLYKKWKYRKKRVTSQGYSY